MEDGSVVVTRERDVVIAELNSPPHNFIDTDMLEGAIEGIEAAASDGARAAVIAARGKSFCAGANFGSKGLTSGEGSRGENFRRNVGDFYRAAVRLFELEVPLVAAVHGAAVGAGVGLAVACDMRVAGPAGAFLTNFVRLGIHPGFGLSVTLPRLIGPSKAADLLLTGRRVEVEEALDLGLADRVVPDPLAGAIEVASEIAAAAPLAVRATRRTLRRGLADEVRSVLEIELAEQTWLADTADSAEGVAALLEKREPVFVGA